MVRLAFLLAVAASVVALACNACHDDPPAASAPAGTSPSATASAANDGGAPAEVVVRVEDDGKTFDIARGATVVFKLVTHGGAGYAWAPSPIDGGPLALEGERTTEPSSDVADVPGAPRLDVYRFVGQGPGTTTIEMGLRRPWGDAPPVKTVRVTVNVR